MSPSDIHPLGSWGKRPLVASRVLNCFSWHSPALWALSEACKGTSLYKNTRFKRKSINKLTTHVSQQLTLSQANLGSRTWVHLQQRVSNTTSKHTSIAEREAYTHDPRAVCFFSSNEHTITWILFKCMFWFTGPGAGPETLHFQPAMLLLLVNVPLWQDARNCNETQTAVLRIAEEILTINTSVCALPQTNGSEFLMRGREHEERVRLKNKWVAPSIDHDDNVQWNEEYNSKTLFL